MMTDIYFPIDINNSTNQHMYGSLHPTLEGCNYLIEYGNVFPIAPHMDFVDEIPPLYMDMDS